MSHLFKRYALILLIAVSFQTTAQNTISDTKALAAQETDISHKIVDLKAKIAFTKNGEKLKLLDSLSNLVQYNPKFKYDSIVTKTIAYALLIDSLNMATHKTANLIYYKNSIVSRPQEGLVLFKKFIGKNLRTQNNNSLARLYLNGADSYFFNNKFDEAITNYEISKSYALKAKDDRLLGFVNLYMGEANESLGGFVKASQNYKKAYSYFLKVKDTFNILNIKSSQSILYSMNGFYEEAQKERDEIIILLGNTNNYGLLVRTYYNSSVDYARLGMHDKRIDYLLKALKFNKKSERASNNQSTILNTLVVAYAENNNIELAEKYFKKVESNPEQNTKGRNKEHYQKAKMHLAFANGANTKALLIAKELLSSNIKKGDLEEIERIQKFISIIYDKLGDSENSLIYLKKHLQIVDSIKSVQKIKALSYYQTLYETEKRDSKIKEQAENIDVLYAQDKIKNKNIRRRNIGLFFLVLLLFIGYFVFRKFKRKAKLKENILLKEVEQLDNNILEINAQKNSVNWNEFRINSDEQWKEFQELFEKEHPKFINRIKVKFSSITAGEIRLLCITRLGLDDITVASILGVNVNSVSQTRRRFMRKSKIESLIEFKELIFNI